MSTEAVTPAQAASPKATAKATKAKNVAKPKKAKAPASHPTFSEMIKKAIITLGDKKGSSRPAILKYIVQNFKVGENITKVNSHLRHALKKGVETKMLTQVKGTGASGSFKLGEKAKAKAAPKKEKKPAAKKAVAKTAAKKTTKKPSTKKTATKEKKVKPKSPKKPAAKKAATAAKPKPKKTSPKKAKAAAPAKPPKKVTKKAAKKVAA